jgi:hypothetical protein
MLVAKSYQKIEATGIKVFPFPGRISMLCATQTTVDFKLIVRLVFREL